MNTTRLRQVQMKTYYLRQTNEKTYILCSSCYNEVQKMKEKECVLLKTFECDELGICRNCKYSDKDNDPNISEFEGIDEKREGTIY